MKILYNGTHVADITNPLGFPLTFLPEETPQVEQDKYTLDPEEVLQYYRRARHVEVEKVRQKRETSLQINVGASSFHISTTVAALTKLKLRADQGTDGFWFDKSGILFPVNADQFADILEQVSLFGEMMYGWQIHHKIEIDKLTLITDITSYDIRAGWM